MTSGKADGTKSDDKQLDAFLHADRADKIPPIHELVKLLLRQQASSLAVLTESKMAEYVDDFVNRKDLESISEGVSKSIKLMAKAVKAEPTLAKVRTTTGVQRGLRMRCATPVLTLAFPLLSLFCRIL